MGSASERPSELETVLRNSAAQPGAAMLSSHHVYTRLCLGERGLNTPSILSIVRKRNGLDVKKLMSA